MPLDPCSAARAPRRPTPQRLGSAFKASTGTEPPPSSKVYRLDKSRPVTAIPEYAALGGVLIAYPGLLAPATGHSQRPARGQCSFGITDELIVRMQQNDSPEPVHIFVMCDDADAKAGIDASLATEAQRLGLRYDPRHLHLVPSDTDTFWTRDFGPCLILNRCVYVPISGPGYEQHDEAALATYRDALPGYAVVEVSGPTAALD